MVPGKVVLLVLISSNTMHTHTHSLRTRRKKRKRIVARIKLGGRMGMGMRMSCPARCIITTFACDGDVMVIVCER